MERILIQRINDLQNQLNMELASKYEGNIDNQLTAKQVLLLELIHNGVNSTKKLAAILNISTSAASQLLNKLEDKEYINRTINKKNRREIILQIAEKGEKYFEKIKRLEEDINQNVYGQLPLEDLQHLARILETLTELVGGKKI